MTAGMLEPRRAPLLVLAVGNPSRGDDALGPLCLERLAARWQSAIAAGEVELLTDFQLQVEHALDVSGRRAVVFIDASVAAPAPYRLEPVSPRAAAEPTTHALAPAAVLETAVRIGLPLPETASVLAIRGVSFELGEPLSDAAASHLDAAVARLDEWCRHHSKS